MKKRLLALALCLVMMTSLLPITAAAEFTSVTINSMQITASGLKQGPLWGVNNAYQLDGATLEWEFESTAIPESTEIKGYITINNTPYPSPSNLLATDPVEGQTYYVLVALSVEWDQAVDCALSENFSAQLTIPGYETALVGEDLEVNDDTADKWAVLLTFSLKKQHEHQWQFGHMGSSLTATCHNPGCTIGEVGVTLTAHSVILPESPFNAKWETTGNFKEAFPNAEIYGPYYFYKESGGYTQVYENTFTPKAGEYQAQVYIYGLPGDEVAEAGILSTDDGTELGGRRLDLWIDYTAVDPAVTAQTGDNRPIELMMASVLFFSVLAAAAFILDHKRKYSR